MRDLGHEMSEPEFPADDGNHSRWRLRKTPAKAPILLYAVSNRHIGFDTHYWGGRTIPHYKSNCAACVNHIQFRWTGFLWAIDAKDNQFVLFEFTEKAGLDLKALLLIHGTLRGLCIKGHRPSGREKGRVVLESKGHMKDPSNLPPDEPLRPAVMHLWGIREEAGLEDDATIQTAFTEQQTSARRARLVPPDTPAAFSAENILDLPGQRRSPLESPVLAAEAIDDLISRSGTNGLAGKRKD